LDRKYLAGQSKAKKKYSDQTRCAPNRILVSTNSMASPYPKSHREELTFSRIDKASRKRGKIIQMGISLFILIF
jgi:hypothetical protein